MSTAKRTNSRNRDNKKQIPSPLPSWANSYIEIMDGGPGTGWSEHIWINCSSETGIVCWKQEGLEQDPDSLALSDEVRITARGRFHVSKGFMGLARSLAERSNKFTYNGPGLSSPDLEFWQLCLLRECVCHDENRGAGFPLLLSLTPTEVQRLSEASDGFRKPWSMAASHAVVGDLIEDEGPVDPLEFRRELKARYGSRYPKPEVWKRIGEAKLADQESLRQYHRRMAAEAEEARNRIPVQQPIAADVITPDNYKRLIDSHNYPADVVCRAKVIHFIDIDDLFGSGYPFTKNTVIDWLISDACLERSSPARSFDSVRELVECDRTAAAKLCRIRETMRERVETHDPNPTVNSMGAAIGRNMNNAAIGGLEKLLVFLDDDRCGLPSDPSSGA